MKETIKQIWQKLPLWSKGLIAILCAICATITASLATSCAPVSKVTTRTYENASVNITISQPSTNDTDVDISPDTDVTLTKIGNRIYLTKRK